MEAATALCSSPCNLRMVAGLLLEVQALETPNPKPRTQMVGFHGPNTLIFMVFGP